MLDFRTSGHQEERNRHRGVGQTGSVGPFRGAYIGKPDRYPVTETSQSGFYHCLLTLALMKFTEKTLPVVLLRTLMALEG